MTGARREISEPLLAIGRIDERNLSPVLQGGADSVAVPGAECRGDPRADCSGLQKAEEKSR